MYQLKVVARQCVTVLIANHGKAPASPVNGLADIQCKNEKKRKYTVKSELKEVEQNSVNHPSLITQEMQSIFCEKQIRDKLQYNAHRNMMSLQDGDNYQMKCEYFTAVKWFTL